MQYRIQHITKYTYEKPVSLGPHVVRLRPAAHAKADILSYSLSIEPECQIRWHYDPWNNQTARLSFPPDFIGSELTITVDTTIETRPVNPFDFFVENWCESLPFQYPASLADELSPFLKSPQGGALFKKFTKEHPPQGGFIDYLVDVNKIVSEKIAYVVREETGIQESEQTLSLQSGSCRDSAVLLMDVYRSAGLAARFASGYLLQALEPEDADKSKEKHRVQLDLHAWAEVYVPGAGWVGLDATSGMLCGEEHIPLACAATPLEAAPVTGTASSVASKFETFSEAVKLGLEVEPERPYTESDWRRILECGQAVDASLLKSGVELTSGGEPTWTTDDMSNLPEWSTQALGEKKWLKAARLFVGLSKRFADGVLPIVGAGKLYPHETSPRWALTLLWRKDEEPIWLNQDLIDWEITEKCRNYSRGIELCLEFGRVLSEKLGVKANLIAGYEDPCHFVVEEENLPDDIELVEILESSDFSDRENRKRLARVLERGLNEVVGYCLPLSHSEKGWFSGSWSFRREHMYLVNGDSPMGLRLPLDRILTNAESVWPSDPSLVEEKIPDKVAAKSRKRAAGGNVALAEAEPEERPRTALCLEPRADGVGVFIPPLSKVDEYLELVTAVEEAAAQSGIKVRIEGYPPSPDPRLRSLSVTPDPGVVEVNLPVCSSLREYARSMALVAETASESGLATEKYQLDGRIIGTGGGHHITLGGPSPLKSPFIENPHILASLIRYFQNHPSLSYLFTGLFVGPCSQAPRIDEARLDSLYELELALAQFPAPDTEAPPWTSDRLLRHILADMTGNTHRAEICIDKLYNPDIATGRLGIVEFRAFEMPFHYKMAVVEMLLLRALVAMFAIRPFIGKPIRWGTALHDKFMLPHYLYDDLRDVLFDLQREGFNFDQEWFRPMLEFRFPVVGRLQAESVELELRVAHEPWHVLAEASGAQNLSRPVDSSMERLQIKVKNWIDNRHIAIVNGMQIPMVRTATVGEFIAGVRFRAWRPPACLQPNINVHHPLKFELVDTWSKRSLGACRYYVVHPEGLYYEEIPLTRIEARSRTQNRFSIGNHTPWPVDFLPTDPYPEHPITLDLRRYLKD
ncbi:MAG: transglutaminase family protein [Candidatus Obscuribacterales bacterium]|nr:transglutaminase family protein [Candidatus Obscuribacterales bacterium]